MNDNHQFKQVFVDETGRRSRLLHALGRAVGVVVACYLVLLVAGFMGASWVPSVDLPIVGDIFSGGDEPDRSAEIADEDSTQPDEAAKKVVALAKAGGPAAVPRIDAAGDVRGTKASSTAQLAGSNSGPNPGSGQGSSGHGEKSLPEPAVSPSPNLGSSGNSENAGPKPKPTPSPDRGSSGKSDNAGPKPKPTPTP